MKTYARNPLKRVFLLLGFLLALTITLSVIVVVNYDSTGVSAQADSASPETRSDAVDTAPSRSDVVDAAPPAPKLVATQ